MSSLFQRPWLRVSWICVMPELRQNTSYFGYKVCGGKLTWGCGSGEIQGARPILQGVTYFSQLVPASLFHVPVTSYSRVSHFWRLCLHYPSTSPKPQQLATQPWPRRGKEGVSDTWGQFLLVSFALWSSQHPVVTCHSWRVSVSAKSQGAGSRF